MNQFSKLVVVIVPALVMLGCGSKGEVKDAGADGGVQQGRAAGVTTGAGGVGSGASATSAAGGATASGSASNGAAGSASGGSSGGSSGSAAGNSAGGSSGSSGSSMASSGTSGAGAAGGATMPGMLPNNMKVFFDYDRSEIKAEFRSLLQAHVSYLAANPTARVTIEGHCDERGTREYNLALGERRAHAIQQFLVLQGAGKDQVKTVTFGEERPDAAGHDESAWKFNRRAVFTYAK